MRAPSKHLGIVKAREKVKQAHKEYSQNQSIENHDLLKDSKELLFSTYMYDRLKGAELARKISHIEEAHAEHR